jgi:hypothetical protein
MDSGPVARRKTLDDIRRELDAEFSPAFADDRPQVATPPEASPDRQGARHVRAAVVGCGAGLLIVLAYVAVTRHATSEPPLPISVMAERPPLTTTAVDAATAPIPAVDAATAPIAAADAAAAPILAVAAVAGQPGNIAGPVLQPVLAPTRSRMPREPFLGPDDWVELQSELRAALSEWLAILGGADAARVSEAEVVLAADGWTAKTRVPMSSRLGLVIHEQRWERGPGGWSIIDDREVAGSRR